MCGGADDGFIGVLTYSGTLVLLSFLGFPFRAFFSSPAKVLRSVKVNKRWRPWRGVSCFTREFYRPAIALLRASVLLRPTVPFVENLNSPCFFFPAWFYDLLFIAS